VCVGVAVSFSQFVEQLACVCGCRHGLKHECVPPLLLDGEDYNLVRDMCRDTVHPYDEVDGVLGKSGVRGAVSYGWSSHGHVERTAVKWLSESCGSRRTGRHRG
jgi:hypothetical protein